jgi:hypothetical protein
MPNPASGDKRKCSYIIYDEFIFHNGFVQKEWDALTALEIDDEIPRAGNLSLKMREQHQRDSWEV